MTVLACKGTKVLFLHQENSGLFMLLSNDYLIFILQCERKSVILQLK